MASRPTGAEKRRARRVPVSLTAHARIGNRFVKEPLGDISAGGLYLKTKELAKMGAEVTVALSLPVKGEARICTLVGSVVRVDRDARGKLCGLGVSLVPDRLGKADLATLRNFLEATAA